MHYHRRHRAHSKSSNSSRGSQSIPNANSNNSLTSDSSTIIMHHHVQKRTKKQEKDFEEYLKHRADKQNSHIGHIESLTPQEIEEISKEQALKQSRKDSAPKALEVYYFLQARRRAGATPLAEARGRAAPLPTSQSSRAATRRRSLFRGVRARSSSGTRERRRAGWRRRRTTRST